MTSLATDTVFDRLTTVGKLYINGEWVDPGSADLSPVMDSTTGTVMFKTALANTADMNNAIVAARDAFDNGPWPRMTHAERATYVAKIAQGIRDRIEDFSQLWPRESGVLYSDARDSSLEYASTWDYYADLASTFVFEEPRTPTAGGDFGLLVREPVGVVAVIAAWNGPLAQLTYKMAPALIAGCTVIVKPASQAPGEAHVLAQIVAELGLPPGVINIVPARRDAADMMIRDSRVDKITFTGSSEVGRHIATVCGDRIARFTLELGGKSAAVVLDDANLETTAQALAAGGCFNTGQVCSSLTRIVVTRHRHDELVDALASEYAKIRLGNPFDERSEMGPLSGPSQRETVEGYVAAGVSEGATIAAGGKRETSLGDASFFQPTVFANVDNSMRIAREEIFGPVISVIPADDEAAAVDIANDTIYGLNSSVFTEDVDRAREVAGRLRSGTVGHNAFRTDFGIAFGGFKQSGVGREGGEEGLKAFFETKTIILNGTPQQYRK
jgi:aldehyde dehydrogenase (NAD+)